MSGYIDNYRLDLSPAVEAMKARMQDKQNQRDASINAFTGVAKLMGTVADSAFRKSSQEQAQIQQLLDTEDGITKAELLELYPSQANYINGLRESRFKADEPNKEVLSELASEAMEDYIPAGTIASEAMMNYVPSDLDLRDRQYSIPGRREPRLNRDELYDLLGLNKQIYGYGKKSPVFPYAESALNKGEL